MTKNKFLEEATIQQQSGIAKWEWKFVRKFN
jgi:hypothetical protein